MCLQGHKWSVVKRDLERDVVEAICRRLKDARIEGGISQQRLAEMAGISRTGLRHIEGLETNPTLYSLLKISGALNLDLEELLKSLR